jgi:hypothetical protein
MKLIEINGEDRLKLAGLFNGHLGGFMPDSILESHMGRAFADDQRAQFAVLELPSIKLSILGGDATHPLAAQYLQNLPRFTQLFFTSPDFVSLAQQVHPGKWIELERYAFSTDRLDIAKLHKFKTQIPEGHRIVKIDLALAKRLVEKKNSFASVHGMNFNTPEDFIARGFGYCALEGSRIACIGSSFVVCNQGIEIQIDTRNKYRGRGLATAVAANLMIHCLENKLTPGWDAATTISAQFAKKLGYTPQGKYTMLVFTNLKFLVSLRKHIQRVRYFLREKAE